MDVMLTISSSLLSSSLLSISSISAGWEGSIPTHIVSILSFRPVCGATSLYTCGLVHIETKQSHNTQHSTHTCMHACTHTHTHTHIHTGFMYEEQTYRLKLAVHLQLLSPVNSTIKHIHTYIEISKIHIYTYIRTYSVVTTEQNHHNYLWNTCIHIHTYVGVHMYLQINTVGFDS